MFSWVDLQHVCSELSQLRSSVDEAVGDVEEPTVRRRLVEMADSLEDQFDEIQEMIGSLQRESTGAASHVEIREIPDSAESRPHVALRSRFMERFGQGREEDFLQGVPPICEMREEWHCER